MSFAGHVIAMIQSLKNNARPKKDFYGSKKNYLEYHSELSKTKAEPKLTPEELAVYTLKAKKEKRTEIIKLFSILLFSLVIVLIIVFYVIKFLK